MSFFKKKASSWGFQWECFLCEEPPPPPEFHSVPPCFRYLHSTATQSGLRTHIMLHGMNDSLTPPTPKNPKSVPQRNAACQRRHHGRSGVSDGRGVELTVASLWPESSADWRKSGGAGWWMEWQQPSEQRRETPTERKMLRSEAEYSKSSCKPKASDFGRRQFCIWPLLKRCF